MRGEIRVKYDCHWLVGRAGWAEEECKGGEVGDEESFVGVQGEGGGDHQGQVREGGRKEAGIPHFAQ